jgi:hypothetical protein
MNADAPFGIQWELEAHPSAARLLLDLYLNFLPTHLNPMNQLEWEERLEDQIERNAPPDLRHGQGTRIAINSTGEMDSSIPNPQPLKRQGTNTIFAGRHLREIRGHPESPPRRIRNHT